MERGKGQPHKVVFPSKFLDKVLEFVELSCARDASEEDQKTIGFNGGCLFLSRRGNDYRRFIKLCELKSNICNPFVIILEGEDLSGWKNFAEVIRQMNASPIKANAENVIHNLQEFQTMNKALPVKSYWLHIRKNKRAGIISSSVTSGESLCLGNPSALLFLIGLRI